MRRSEQRDGAVVARTTWPIGPPTVRTRNVFLVIIENSDGSITAQVLGDVSRIAPPPGE